MNKEQYDSLASLRIISSYFYLKDRAALSEKWTLSWPEFRGETPGRNPGMARARILQRKELCRRGKIPDGSWREWKPEHVKPDFWFYLGDAQTQKDFTGAEAAYEKYLQVATDPAAKAKTLLALGAAKISAHKPDDAQKIAEEIMTLQPEGRVNAEARLLAGDVQVERQHFEEAGKAFMGVALLYDDPAITPRALQKAAFAYEKAGTKTKPTASQNNSTRSIRITPVANCSVW